MPRRKALPWLEKFDGTRAKFPAWKQQMSDKIAIDADLMDPRRSQWYGIYNCIGEGPKEVMTTFSATGGDTWRLRSGGVLSIFEEHLLRPGARR